MSTHIPHAGVERRRFLSRLTAAAAGLGALLARPRSAAASDAQASTAQAPAPTPAPQATAASFQPARHAEDDWFDQTTAKHRFFMDTSTVDGIGQALAFARNFLEANASGYKL